MHAYIPIPAALQHTLSDFVLWGFQGERAVRERKRERIHNGCTEHHYEFTINIQNVFLGFDTAPCVFWGLWYCAAKTLMLPYLCGGSLHNVALLPYLCEGSLLRQDMCFKVTLCFKATYVFCLIFAVDLFLQMRPVVSGQFFGRELQWWGIVWALQRTATHCNALQHTATNNVPLVCRQTVTHCNVM